MIISCRTCKRAWIVKKYTPPLRCNECHSKKLKFDRRRSEIYCAECGLVHNSNISYVGGKRVIYPLGLRI